MSLSKDLYEAKRWLQTAIDDFETAEFLRENKRYSYSCYLFQQSAEKALKALWYLEGKEPWGHSVSKLINDFPSKDKYSFIEKLIGDANFLDKFYIPTRYPNGLPDLTPAQIFNEEDAKACRDRANRILEAIKSMILK